MFASRERVLGPLVGRIQTGQLVSIRVGCDLRLDFKIWGRKVSFGNIAFQGSHLKAGRFSRTHPFLGRP